MGIQEQVNPASESVALTFFNDVEARTVEAITERIIPGEGGVGGATDAGVVYYVDRAVSGFSTDLQHVYRRGLRELDDLCQRDSGLSFVDLPAEQQDEVLRSFLGLETGEPSAGLQFGIDDQAQGSDGTDAGVSAADRRLVHRLFAVLREHTVEGFFGDPVYGGNRNAVGWKLVGFPGAQWGYTADQMKAGFDATTITVKTLSDLRADLASLPDNSTYNLGGER